MREDPKSDFPESNEWRLGNMLLRRGRDDRDLADQLRCDDDTHSDRIVSEREKYSCLLEKYFCLLEKKVSLLEKYSCLLEKYFCLLE